MENIDANNNPEEIQETAPSVEEQNPVESNSEVEQTPAEEEQTIPYERFQEVISDKNELKDDIKTLKSEIEALKTQTPPVEEEEPFEWKDKKQSIVNEAMSKIEIKMKGEAEAKALQDKTIETKFDQLTKLGVKVTPEIKKSILEKMVKTGNGDVMAVYLSNKTNVDKTQKVEQQKKEGIVPPTSPRAGVDVPAFDYNSIQGKSPMDIVREQGEG